MSDEKAGKFLRRLTPKSVMTEVGVNLLALQRPVESRVLYDLFGTIVRVQSKTSDTTSKGVSIAFVGEFEAVTSDGEVFVSGKCFIPVLEDVLFAAFQGAKDKDEKASLDIALRVAIKTAPADKPSMTGYEFDVQSLIPVKSSNRIAALRQLAAQNSPALAAPVVGKKPNQK